MFLEVVGSGCLYVRVAHGIGGRGRCISVALAYSLRTQTRGAVILGNSRLQGSWRTPLKIQTHSLDLVSAPSPRVAGKTEQGQGTECLIQRESHCSLFEITAWVLGAPAISPHSVTLPSRGGMARGAWKLCLGQR